jgi:hypothetical protein
MQFKERNKCRLALRKHRTHNAQKTAGKCRRFLCNLRTVNGVSVMKQYTVKDSGDRQQFSSGAVRDLQTGKGRFDLISPIFLFRLAKHTESGAVKYTPRNWEKGIPMSRMIDSAIRHLLKYLMGWRDEDHLVAAAWNIMCMVHFEETRPDLDDLPRYTDSEGNILNAAPGADNTVSDSTCRVPFRHDDGTEGVMTLDRASGLLTELS